jgi:hypothetical protein
LYSCIYINNRDIYIYSEREIARERERKRERAREREIKRERERCMRACDE